MMKQVIRRGRQINAAKLKAEKLMSEFKSASPTKTCKWEGCTKKIKPEYQYCYPHNRLSPESSPTWNKGDAAASEFFVYLLKLSKNDFYAGQTRELRERLSEHRDGSVPSTAGKEPKLVWFAIVPTREAAADFELRLKKLVESNPRELRRMIIKFNDLIDELDYS